MRNTSYQPDPETTRQIDALRADRGGIVKAIADAGGRIVRGNSVCCPFHDDRHPSASIRQGTDGAWRLTCHTATCGFSGDVIDVLARSSGRTAGDVLKELRGNNGRHGATNGNGHPRPGPAPTQSKRSYVSAEKAIEGAGKKIDGGKLAKVWSYPSDAMRVARFNLPDGKEFRPVHRLESGAWAIGDPPGLLPLYRGDELPTDGPILVLEGERCADLAREIGFAAVTSAHGAKSPHKTDWTPIAGRDIWILPDADADGEKYAANVARILNGLGCRVKIVHLPGLPDGGDIVEIDAAIGAGPEATRAEIIRVAEAAPIWTPETTAGGSPDGNGRTGKANSERRCESEADEVADSFSGPPIPLEPTKPPTLGSGIFPGIVGEMIDATAAALEVPAELPATFALVSLAVAAQGRWSVHPEPNYFEQLAFWAACALISGSRKSEAMKIMTGWGWDWQRERGAAIAGEIKQAASDDALLTGRLKTLRLKASKSKDPTDFALLKQQIDELEKSRKPIPVAPRIICEDVTPEFLATMTSEHGERMGVFSDEGGPLENFRGRYYAAGAGANIDFILKAHAGIPAAVDRGSRPSLQFQRPLVSIGLSPQPQIIADLVANEVFRRRGMVGRFWLFMPESTIGFRRLRGVPIPDDLRDQYRARLVDLLESPTAPNGHPRPLGLSPDAWRAWKGFALEIEMMMKPDGELATMTDWGGKLPGATARVAGLFHLAIHGSGALQADQIEVDSMARAIALARLAMGHAKYVYTGLSGTSELDGARRAWREAQSPEQRKDRRERYGDSAIISARDLWNPHRGSFKSVLEFEPVIRLLVDHNHLAELPNVELGKPGRPSRRFRIHPLLEAE